MIRICFNFSRFSNTLNAGGTISSSTSSWLTDKCYILNKANSTHNIFCESWNGVYILQTTAAVLPPLSIWARLHTQCPECWGHPEPYPGWWPYLLARFAQEWPQLQAGGLLLPDLVEFYQWLHTALSKPVSHRVTACVSYSTAAIHVQNYSLVPRPHPTHMRRRGLVSQVQIFGLTEVLKPCDC